MYSIVNPHSKEDDKEYRSHSIERTQHEISQSKRPGKAGYQWNTDHEDRYRYTYKMLPKAVLFSFITPLTLAIIFLQKEVQYHQYHNTGNTRAKLLNTSFIMESIS